MNGRAGPPVARAGRKALFEALEPLVEALLVLLDGRGGAGELDVVDGLRALEVDPEHAVVGALRLLIERQHGRAVEVGAGHVEIEYLAAGDLHVLDLRLFLAGRGFELSLPA